MLQRAKIQVLIPRIRIPLPMRAPDVAAVAAAAIDAVAAIVENASQALGGD